MEIQISNTLSDDTWERFVLENSESNVFHSKEMYQIFQAADGYHPSLWVALNEFQQPQSLLLPVHVDLIPEPLAHYFSRTVVFGGVLCGSNHGSMDAFRKLLHVYRSKTERSALFTEIRNGCHQYALDSIFSGVRLCIQRTFGYIQGFEVDT